MKTAFLILILISLSGCYLLDPNLPMPKREYGCSSQNTISVTAQTGFRRPGVHYVSKGTTLRQFLVIASILPNREWGAAEFFCGCRVQQLRNGQAAGFVTPARPTETQLDEVLEDGAMVSILKWNN
jgi:hypothetical protein